MTFVECPQCTGKSLSVATRCPHCGAEFPPRPLRRSPPADGGGARRAVFLAGGLVLGAAVLTLVARRVGPKEAAGSSVRPLGGPPTASAQADAAPSRITDAPPPKAAPALDRTPSGVMPPTGPAPSPKAAPPVPTSAVGHPAATPETIHRYARTWVHVREAPTRTARSTLILDPGVPVLVDSLSRGWYRVLIDGRAIGYAHRANLGDAPPPP